jgi:hypothetical protein
VQDPTVPRRLAAWPSSTTRPRWARLPGGGVVMACGGTTTSGPTTASWWRAAEPRRPTGGAAVGTREGSRQSSVCR